MYKLPKFFEQEITTQTKLTKKDFKTKEEFDYFSKLEKIWRTGKKLKDDKDNV